MPLSDVSTATTPSLRIAYEQAGPADGFPVVLSHGFPYDPRSYEGAGRILADAGARVIVPYLRGYGPTRFVSADVPRSGQQAALGQDLIDLLDALEIPRAVVAGYDWGGRAACIAAAVSPERVAGLVTVGGYNVQNIEASVEPSSPAVERGYWYQYFFHTERGRRSLERDRDRLCELLWRDWSPTWTDAGAAFARSAPSLHNPDFVEVVIHSYRHRYGLVPGDARHDALEARLAEQPDIVVPTVVIDSGADGLGTADPSDTSRFTGQLRHVVFDSVGHNPPQEAPAAFAAAVTSLL